MVRRQAGQARVEVICDEGRQKQGRLPRPEKPIPDVYPVLDTDLARDNVENDIPAADLEDL